MRNCAVIGGADGPTAIFVTASALPADVTVIGALLAASIVLLAVIGLWLNKR